MSEPKVAILLSTLNGGRFLAEQIASILAQSYRNIRLYWRDDGSGDDTIAIMARLGITPRETDAVGITASYKRLLKKAYDDGIMIFAFADQDDVWTVDKVERGVAALRDLTIPALYCARQTMVDADLRRIGVSPPFREPIGFPAALTQNIAAGCTIMLNQAAASLVLQTLRNQRYHDWWCYLIVAAAGGQIIADDSQVILYRQHGGNVIGAPPNLINRAWGAFWRGPKLFMDIFREHVTILQSHRNLLPFWVQDVLSSIATAMYRGPAAKWRALRLPGFRRQTRLEQIVFRLWFLIG